MTKAELMRRREVVGIPFAPIARPEDLFTDPHLAANGSLLETEFPDGTVTQLPRLPVAVDEYDFGLLADPPRIDQHSAEILSEWAVKTKPNRR